MAQFEKITVEKDMENSSIWVGAVIVTLSLVLAAPVNAGWSGDSALDAAIPILYNIRAGGSGPGVNRTGNEWRCGTTLAHPKEQSCPNDATYSPAEATGGRQSWAVGLRQLYVTELDYQCWIEVGISAGGLGDYSIQCGLTPVEMPVGTFGVAMAVLVWGEDNSATQAFSNQPTSIMAFSESLLDDCNPENPITGFGAAPCWDNSDSSYVDVSGYEGDISFEDPACRARYGIRHHDPSDRRRDCFHYFDQRHLSNLPDDYRDTTESDPAETFNVGFGSSSGFAIESGKEYVVMQEFMSIATPFMLERKAEHTGTITAFKDTPGADCDPFAPETCYFPVDTANVGLEADGLTRRDPFTDVSN